jgi:uncharacterized membrane protein YbhN (UPF0104 family)
VLAVALVLLGLVLRPDIARRLVRLVAVRLPSRFGPRIEEATDHALQGLAPLSNPPVALRLGLWSLATWGINSLTVYLMLLAFNLEVTPMAAVVLVVVTNLSMAVPSAPGYIGPFELAVVAVLGALGQPKEVTQTFAIVYHFIGLAPVALMGVVAAIQQGVGLTAFRSAPPPEPEPALQSVVTPPARPTTLQDER